MVKKLEKAEKKEVPANIDQLLDYMAGKFGAGTVIKGRHAIVDVDSFPTGIITIDRAFGCGGVPLGRIMELYGAESSGKTTTTLRFIAACQKHFFTKKDRYGTAAFVDAEHALDPEWADKNGVDMEELLICQPDSGEEALNVVETFLRSNIVDLVVVDSVAALVPKAELDGEVGEHHVGAQARMMSQGLRKLKGVAAHAGATVVFINQVREKVGVVFGNPEITPGGKALKYYATVRAEVSRAGIIKEGDDAVGITAKIKMVKNKAAAPFAVGQYDICFGKPARPVFGIDPVTALIDVAIESKLLKRSGNFLKWGDTSLGNGLTNAAKFLRENPEIYKQIEQQTYNSVFHCHQDTDADQPRSVDEILEELGEE